MCWARRAGGAGSEQWLCGGDPSFRRDPFNYPSDDLSIRSSALSFPSPSPSPSLIVPFAPHLVPSFRIARRKTRRGCNGVVAVYLEQHTHSPFALPALLDLSVHLKASPGATPTHVGSLLTASSAPQFYSAAVEGDGGQCAVILSPSHPFLQTLEGTVLACATRQPAARSDKLRSQNPSSPSASSRRFSFIGSTS